MDADSNSERRPRFTRPGVDVLTRDVTSFVTSVVDCDSEIVIGFRGLVGSVLDDDWFDGDGADAHATLTLMLPGLPESGLSDYLGTLANWRDRHVPVRFISAAGRVPLLIGGDGQALPVPSREGVSPSEPDRDGS